MKTHPDVRRVRLAALASLMALFASSPAHADTYTWTGGGGNNSWGTGANWQGGSPPPSGQNTSLIFAGTTNLAPQQNVAFSFPLNALAFDSTAGAFTLGGSILNFQTSTGNALPTLTQNSASAETVNNALTLSNNLTVGGTGAGILTLGGNINGAGSLTMSGSGTTRLLGNNAYTGGTVLQSGVLNVGSAGALGSSGTLSFSGGTLQFSAANASDYSSRFSGAGNQAIRLDTNGQNVTLGNGIGGTGTSLTKLGAGTLALAAANTYTGTTAVSAGTLAVGTGGSLTGGDDINVGEGATLEISGTGSISLDNHMLWVDSTSTSAPAATATLGDSGSLSTGQTVIGYFGAGVFNQSGGSFTTNGNTLYLGVNIGSGLYTLSGGTLTTGRTQVSNENATTGTFTQSGGTHTTDTLGLTGDSTSTVGTYNLNGGTLNAGQVVAGNGFNSIVGTSTFNFNGGTLQASANNPSFFQGLTRANVQAGRARIDSNGFNITVAQNLAHDPALGATADGGLSKIGDGTLTLTGANTFTGPTSVNRGTLEVNNTGTTTGKLAATGSILINNGGTLLLSGSAGITDRLNNAASLTIASGCKLATGGLSEGSPAAGVAGVGALTLMGGSSIDFLAGANGSALLAASGIISGSGTISILNWTGTAQTDSGAAGNDRLLFVSAPNFTAAQLSQFSFYNDSGALVGGGGAREISFNGFTEIVPVPEPATWAGGALLMVGAAGTIRRRFRRSTAA